MALQRHLHLHVAAPFNIQLANDRNGDTNFNDRPAGVVRNAGQGFDYQSLDLRLSRTFPLGRGLTFEAILEGLQRAEPDELPGAQQHPGSTFCQPGAVVTTRDASQSGYILTSAVPPEGAWRRRMQRSSHGRPHPFFSSSLGLRRRRGLPAKYARAASMSRPICSVSASSDGNLRSSRRRSRKKSRTLSP